MKAAEFDYLRAGSLAEVCEALAAGGGERKIIAGGQTLVPMMAMRLARPTMLIDINAVTGLQGIAAGDGTLTIKAATRQRQAEHAPEVRTHAPLLAKALPFVGHQQTRNRGTVGGSIVHADPAAEIPLVALTLDATLMARGVDGEFEIDIDGFFQAPMMTALEPAQCLTEIRLPVWNGGAAVGTGFQELSVRDGDFAIAAAAVQLALDGDGNCIRAAVGVGGAGATPLRLDAVAEALLSTRLGDQAVRDAAALVPGAVEPDSDLHASADYRRRVAGVLVERAIVEARDEARGTA